MNTLRLSLAAFVKVFRLNRKLAVFSIAAGILIAAQSSANVWLSKVTIDSLTGSNNTKFILFAALMFTLQLLKLLLEAASQYTSKITNESFTIQTHKELIELVAAKELLEKENPRFTGDFSLWMLGAGKYLDSYAGVLLMIQFFFTVVFNLYYVMRDYWYLGILVVLFSIARAFILYHTMRRRVEITQVAHRVAREHEYFYYLLTGASTQKELTLFRAVRYYKDKWFDRRMRYSKYELEMERLQIKANSWGQGLSIVSTAIVTFGVAFMILGGKLTIGDYVAITMAAVLAETGIMLLITQAVRLSENAAHIEAFMQNAKPVIVRNGKGESFQFKQTLTVSGLSFRYPNREDWALQDVDIVIRKGQKVAIVGDNGSGKSTLVKILLGLYPVEHGMVDYDGIDMADIEPSSMWKQTSAIFQDFIQYMGTVRENVGIGLSDQDMPEDEVIWQAIDDVGLTRLRHTGKGLDSDLGYLTDESINLSGGQWQRLALARAFMRDSELIVFDEPTAALDPMAEAELFERIMDMDKDKTLLIISHRVGIARKADLIVVMREGKIVESGQHDNLLAAGGYYSEMWEKQSSFYV